MALGMLRSTKCYLMDKCTLGLLSWHFWNGFAETYVVSRFRYVCVMLVSCYVFHVIAGIYIAPSYVYEYMSQCSSRPSGIFFDFTNSSTCSAKRLLKSPQEKKGPTYPNSHRIMVAARSSRGRSRQALSVPDLEDDAAERKRVLNILAQRRYRMSSIAMISLLRVLNKSSLLTRREETRGTPLESSGSRCSPKRRNEV